VSLAAGGVGVGVSLAAGGVGVGVSLSAGGVGVGVTLFVGVGVDVSEGNGLSPGGWPIPHAAISVP